MGNNIELTLTMPVYYTIHKKTKNNTTHLIGSNWLRNVHFYVKNKVKQDTAKHILNQLSIGNKIKSPYKVKYTYFYKNSGSDLMNVASATSKILLDALQDPAFKVIADDTVLHCIEEKAVVGGQDKLNPRMEILIQEV